jgi:hypothetical protein
MLLEIRSDSKIKPTRLMVWCFDVYTHNLAPECASTTITTTTNTNANINTTHNINNNGNNRNPIYMDSRDPL